MSGSENAVAAIPFANTLDKPGDAPTAALRRRLNVLNETELAALLGVERRTLQTWRARGEGPSFVKVGNVLMFREEDVTAWLAHCVELTPQSY